MLINVTGPECSGKTTLTKFLKNALDVKVVGEFAREYLEKTGGKYGIVDLDVIAQGQLSGIRDAGYGMRDTGCEIRDWVITDTFLLVILIWSLDKFGRVSDLVSEMYVQNQPDFYLLCRPDLDWKYDKLREDQYGRDRLYEQYLEHIKKSGVPYFIVEGKGEKRMERARCWVRSLMQNKLP